VGTRKKGGAVGKPIFVNPLKTSPALGAAYAIQGIKGAVPIFHAAPGCTFLGKVLLTQHLKEPVGLLGTDIKEMPTIMGGLEELEKRIIEVYEKFKPSLIGIIGTALSEVRGEDIRLKIKDFKSSIVNSQSSIVYIPCPDYMGGFSDGYGITVKRIVEKLPAGGPKILRQINLLPSPSLTPGDVDEIKDMIDGFGLKAIVLPDISVSMDGSKDKFSNLPHDGTSLEDIALMGRSSATIAIGEGAKEAGEVLMERFHIPLYHLPVPIGIETADDLIRHLMNISGAKPPEGIKRWRKRLIDGMVDTHLLFADKKVAIGIDKEMSSEIAAFCSEMGMEILNFKFQISNFKSHDLEDLEDLAEGADLIITNSHGKGISERLGIPLLRMGFPVFDRFGEPLKVRVGYRGILNFLFDMANIFQEGHNELYHRNHARR